MQKNSSPSFFKVIFSNTNHKLRIPPEFVKMYKRDVVDRTIYLTVPDDGGALTWKVESIRRGREVWLEKGWQRFAEYYFICDGHFLTFTLEGNSNFIVTIFDRSATEITYPINPISESQDASPPRKHTRTQGGDGELKFPKREDDDENMEDGRKEPKTPTERAKAFKSSNPFFTKLMHPSCVPTGPGRCHRMAVPLEFVRRTFKEERANISLQVVDDSRRKTWTVVLLTKHAHVTSGWMSFAVDNNLKTGDVCIFEMINSKKYVFRVNIFRAR